MLPRTLKNYNLFIDGDSYAGRVVEASLPKLKRKMEKYRAGGMSVEVNIDMGMELLEVEFTLAEYSPTVIGKFGKVDVEGVPFKFKGAMQRDDASNKVDSVEVIMRGRWEEIDRDKVKSGDKSEMKIKAVLAYYEETIAGELVAKIDAVNMIEMFGGTDYAAPIRGALGI